MHRFIHLNSGTIHNPHSFPIKKHITFLHKYAHINEKKPKCTKPGKTAKMGSPRYKLQTIKQMLKEITTHLLFEVLGLIQECDGPHLKTEK